MMIPSGETNEDLFGQVTVVGDVIGVRFHNFLLVGIANHASVVVGCGGYTFSFCLKGE